MHASNLARLGGVVLTCLLIAGCASDVAGTATTTSEMPPTPATTSSVNEFDWITSVLPDATELSGVVGHQITSDGIPPLVGSKGDLRDTVAGSAVVTEQECIGVAYPLLKQAFVNAPVQAVSYSTQSTITYGVVALTSAEEARTSFNEIVDQWQKCEGRTVINATGTVTFSHEIIDVNAGDRMISAVVNVSSPGGAPVRNQRALGVTKDCIVDVEVPSDDGSQGARDTESVADQLVNLMLAKVDSTRP